MNPNDDGRGDFDFFHGRWTSHNRKLANVLDRTCTTWVEFDSTSSCAPVLGGLGNIEPFHAPEMPPAGHPMDAITLRIFEPETGIWRIWWISARQGGHIDDNPMAGRFDGRHGEFLGVEVIDGAEVRVRWDWDRTDPGRPRWEQRFSYDGGATWTLNWTTTHLREGR